MGNRIQKKLTVSGIWSHKLYDSKICKNIIKIISVLEQNGLRMKHFKSRNEVMSMRHYLSGFSNMEVTM
jgi:hypothetical protein